MSCAYNNYTLKEKKEINRIKFIRLFLFYILIIAESYSRISNIVHHYKWLDLYLGSCQKDGMAFAHLYPQIE